MATQEKSEKSGTSELVEYRVAMFAEMGFTPIQSKKLADAKDSKGWPVDVHFVRRMLANGCAKSVALRILL